MMLILVKILRFGAKTRGGGWSNSQGKNRKAGSLCLSEILGSSFNLAKFHPNWRDGMYHPCLGPLVNSVLNATIVESETAI